MRSDPRAYLDIYLVEFVVGNWFVFIFDATLLTGILDNSPKLPLAGVVEVSLGDCFQTLPGPGRYVRLIDGIEPAKVDVEPVGYVAIPLARKRIGDERYCSIGPPTDFGENKCQLTRLYSVKCPITRPALSLFT
jgi:hypothetical protein